MRGELVTVLFELITIVSLVAFCVVVWWPAALLVVAAATGLIAWNRMRGGKR